MRRFRRFRRFVDLPWRRQRLLVGTLVLSIVVRTGLRLSSFRRTATLLDLIPEATGPRPSLEDVRWATIVANWQLPSTTCLTKGLVAHTLCRRYGHPADLYVGVDRESDGFVAHSWVESGGRVVVGDDVDLDRYEPLGVLE
mgnify:CR=1 FL=1